MNYLQQADSTATRRPRRRLAQLAGAVALACAILPSAQANTTIDFENAPLNLLGNGDYFTDNGFYVGAYSNSALGQPGDLVGVVAQGSDQSCWNMACPSAASNPSRYVMGLNDGYLDITHTTGQAFSIQSFDASFVGAYDSVTYPAVPGLVRIQGFLSNGTSLSQTYSLGGMSSSGFQFGHFLTSGAFATTQFVEVAIFGFVCNTSGNCSAFSSNQGQFAIDNIATSAVAPVPEPETWLMFGSGLLGLAAVARRRRAADAAAAAAATAA